MKKKTPKKVTLTERLKTPTKVSLTERLKTPPPPFFKKLRNAGLGMAAIAGTLLSAPVALPAIIIKIASYLLVAGTTVSAVSQSTTEDVNEPKPVKRGK